MEALTSYLDDAPDFDAGMDAYFDEYSDMDTGPAARGPEYFRLNKTGRMWTVRQIMKDPEGDNSFAFEAIIDLDASDEAGEVRFASLTLDHT